MPTVSCRRCNALVDVSDRSRIGRVWCLTCGEWFTLDLEVDDSSTAITTGPIDRPRRPGGRRDLELDDDDEPIDDEARRRIRRRQRHIAWDEDPVRPPKGRGFGLAAQILIGLIGLGELAAFAVGIHDVDAEMRRIVRRDDISANGIEFVTFGLAGVAFFAWLVKAHSNIEFLRGQKMRWSSNWAVGSFFLPLVNLVIPYLVVQEMWRAVDPGPVDESDLESQRRGDSGLVIAWWGLWVAASGVMMACGNFLFPFPAIARIWWIIPMLIAHALFAVDSVLAILVIRSMIWRQEVRWKTLIEEAGADA